MLFLYKAAIKSIQRVILTKLEPIISADLRTDAVSGNADFILATQVVVTVGIDL